MHSLDLGHYSRFATEIKGCNMQVSSYHLSQPFLRAPVMKSIPLYSQFPPEHLLSDLRGCSTHEPNFWVHVPFPSVPDYLLKGKGLAGRVWV